MLLEVTKLVAPPQCTREDLYDLVSLTLVCRFWRAVLINQPRIWSTIVATHLDRRSFVEACLERSHPVPLDVKMEAHEEVLAHPDCSCGKDDRGRLFPNEMTPCEWHFQFECLAEPKHSRRIRTLEICSASDSVPEEGRKEPAVLGCCRLFTSSFPGLAALKWEGHMAEGVEHLFSTPSFPPSPRSLAYSGIWNNTIASVKNLTSFVFESGKNSRTNIEAIRLFMLNNQSLESLAFRSPGFRGGSKGPPVPLPNLKSLNVDTASKKLSTIIRVPALGHLSSLQVTPWGSTGYRLRATGDGITFSAMCFKKHFTETWKGFTGYARPVLHHVRLDGRLWHNSRGKHNAAFLSVLKNAHTLEVGSGYFPLWYDRFQEDLKQLGQQLKVIRFVISNRLELTEENDEDEADRVNLLRQIEDLVRYRFEHGRPFSTVERMVVGGSGRTNRHLDYLWRSFYGSRKLGEYVLPA